VPLSGSSFRIRAACTYASQVRSVSVRRPAPQAGLPRTMHINVASGRTLISTGATAQLNDQRETVLARTPLMRRCRRSANAGANCRYSALKVPNWAVPSLSLRRVRQPHRCAGSRFHAPSRLRIRRFETRRRLKQRLLKTSLWFRHWGTPIRKFGATDQRNLTGARQSSTLPTGAICWSCAAGPGLKSRSSPPGEGHKLARSRP
jgi:hypothetical protein